MRTLDPRDVHTVASNIVIGASTSLSILANVGFGFAHTMTELTTEELFMLADQRLDRRAVLGFSFENDPLVESFLTSAYTLTLGFSMI